MSAPPSGPGRDAPATAPPAAGPPPSRRWVPTLLVAAALPAAAAAVVLHTLSARRAWPDPPDAWLLAPQAWRGLDESHLRWMAETVRGGERRPLAWLSLAATEALGGSPGAHFAVQLGLHAVCAALLGALVHRALVATGADRVWRKSAPLAAAFAAAAWAVHPLRVESVALLDARGDVLATAFGLVAALALLGAIAGPRLGRASIAVAAVASVLASLASPMSAAFVVPVWALVRWTGAAVPGSRAARGPNAWPLALVATPPVLSLLATLSVRPPDGTPPSAAVVASAGHAILAPVWDTVWPRALHPFHGAPPGFPDAVPASWWVQSAIVALLGAWAVWGAARRRGLALAALAALSAAAVGHALGHEPGGSDRVSYAATLPLFAAAGLVLGDGAGCLLAFLGVPLAAGAIWLPATVAGRVAASWTDDGRIAARTLDADPANDRIRGALGDRARRRGARAEAEAQYVRSTAGGGARPYAEAGLGALALDRGDAAAAVARLERAAAAGPWIAATWLDLGNARRALGRIDDSVAALETAVGLDSESPAAWFALGRARAAQGDRRGAAVAFRRSLALAPDDGRAREELARLGE